MHGHQKAIYPISNCLPTPWNIGGNDRTAFLGNDEVLKDELKKNMPILDNVKLGSSWEEIAQGKNENRLKIGRAHV